MSAALKEFGTHGYKNASTNRIYPEAEVSKGLIFKIFGSKEELFYAVFVWCLDNMVNELNEIEYPEHADIYTKMITVIMWKIKYSNLHPDDAKVMLEAVGKPPKGLEKKIAGHMQKLTKLSMRYFFDDIPMDNIRPEYSKADVMNYLEIALIGLQARYVDRELTPEYLDSIRDDSIKFIKTLIRGMEKNNG